MSLVSRTIGVLALALVSVAFLAALYIVSGRSSVPLTFSPTQVLGATWITYKERYIEPTSGRTVDPLRNGDTTSEGESYTMLRAVWQGDKATFDTSWKFTEGNLQHSGDHLFSWLYGATGPGRYGVLTAENGQVSASDADEDIALALIFAYARWQDPAYLTAARAILADIWNGEVIMVGGRPYLVADNLEKGAGTATATVNPSYLAPEDYRVFALVDTAHPWQELIDSSYDLLGKAIDAPLDTGKSAGIPPDWITLDRRTGEVGVLATATTTANFSFDALRVPWRLALDYQWSGDARDLALLAKMRFFTYTWDSAHAIGASYRHDGTPVNPSQAPALYGGTMGYFLLEDPKNAAAVYDGTLVSLYNPDINEWKERLSYYDDNWAWFGIALYNRLLPDLTRGLPASAWAR